jgi:cephalosporin hydroxylase
MSEDQVVNEPARTPKAVADDFHRLYYELPERTWLNTRWLGVRAQKLPLDLWVLQEIIFETRPDLIVETGVYEGGSTLFVASVLDLLGAGEIISVDIDLSRVDDRVRSHPRVTLIEASSTDPSVVERIEAAAHGRRTMVDLDSDHSATHVLGELRSYANLVSEGCYLVVEDTNVNENPVLPGFGPGPMEAMDEWLAADSPPFQRDLDREKYMFTFNPRGYLRRVSG